jgi:uncharacterized protein (TIGR02453 family)
MNRVPFRGFSTALFQFLSELVENNSKEWFDAHRDEYKADVLDPIKGFVSELGPVMRMLNEEFDIEPRVGRTISRINNDLRFHKNRPPYRPSIHVAFPRRGKKWASEAMLYLAISGHGISVGFYPGGYKQPRTGPVQEGIRKNLRLFQRYLDERRISENYWELADGAKAEVTKWPLPKNARRWMNLDSFTVGEYFPSSERMVSRRSFLDTAQEILLDLYPLWLFAMSDNLRDDIDLYWENVEMLARPLSKAAGSSR